MITESRYIMKNVRWVLLSLGLEEFTHVSIRRHKKNGIEYVGGGRVSDMINRYGDLIITDSWICDNILCIYVE